MPAVTSLPDADARTIRLLGVVLADALDTIGKGRRASGLREARGWVCADVATPFSFEEACETFGLPPRALRRHLGLRAPAPHRASTRGWLRPPRR